jgi:tetratricopeptide (TPR) repeat protein
MMMRVDQTRTRWRCLAAIATVLLFALASTPAVRAQPSAPALSDRQAARDAAAVKAYKAGRYREALSIFEELHGETRHTTYLRNIGRCHQLLREPDQAIRSFEEYLRTSRDLTESERQEVRGYVREMEALKEERRAAATPPPVLPVTPPPVASSPATVPLRPAAPSTTAAPPFITAPVTEPPTSDRAARPFYTRWWFWGGLAGAAALTAAGLAASGAFSSGGGCGPGPDRDCKTLGVQP